MSAISGLLKKEFIRFAVVGVLATAIHYGVYLLFLRILSANMSYHENIAYSIGYIVSFVFNFFLTSIFTFKTKANVKKSIGFVLCHLINFGIHNGLLKLYLWLSLPSFTLAFRSHELLVTPTEYAPFLVFAIAVPINFLLVRLVFKSNYTQ
ncbi:MAG: GtrA family protein [Bacteroidales bacterium]|jgi:putative flippase GtrA|nr:GtrA family protein [Bacteroidales bacterium]